MLAKLHYFFAILYVVLGITLCILFWNGNVSIRNPFHVASSEEMYPCPTYSQFAVLCAELRVGPSLSEKFLTSLVPGSFVFSGFLSWLFARLLKRKPKIYNSLQRGILSGGILLLPFVVYYVIAVLIYL